MAEFQVNQKSRVLSGLDGEEWALEKRGREEVRVAGRGSVNQGEGGVGVGVGMIGSGE